MPCTVETILWQFEALPLQFQQVHVNEKLYKFGHGNQTLAVPLLGFQFGNGGFSKRGQIWSSVQGLEFY